jgi:glyoxylate carboligase
VIRERVTNMAIGTGLDNITELRSSPCRGEDAPTAISLLD